MQPRRRAHALDEYAAEQLKPSARAAALALEVDRLERMEATFLKEAIANHHVQAGTLVVKISSRKAQLLGLDQPLAVRMDVSQVVEQDTGTSTERMLKALQELKASDPHAKEREEFNEMLRQRDEAARRQIERDDKEE